ncbi:MAG: hypothetical protein HZC28_00430 [Spirochaetes bacterium]|nr:hypothetical protein [Spirochaetota bacterium]
MEDYWQLLDSEEPADRLKGLELIGVMPAGGDRAKIIRKLKDMMLDWDDDVRAQVSAVLAKYAGK